MSYKTSNANDFMPQCKSVNVASLNVCNDSSMLTYPYGRPIHNGNQATNSFIAPNLSIGNQLPHLSNSHVSLPCSNVNSFLSNIHTVNNSLPYTNVGRVSDHAKNVFAPVTMHPFSGIVPNVNAPSFVPT